MPNPVSIVPLSDLELDPENPRLPASLQRDQQSMLDYIAATTSIEELMEAIAQNDFFPGEPLIVTKSNGRYIVVEGNRRLTALKLLQDPQNCSKPGDRMRQIAANAAYRPDQIPVIDCPTRTEVLPYLGFRHITGVKPWEPLAKARYIKQMFDHTDPNTSIKERYFETARTIGSRRDHIKRSLDALAVYDVIKDADFYGIEGLSEESLKFSVLSTAIADERIGLFIGTEQETQDGIEPTDPIINPSALKERPISELVHWLYKQDEKGKTKVGESRNLRLLSAVIGNRKALESFRSGSPLKIAYQLTSDSTEDFMGLLYQAEGLLSEASSMVATVEYSEDGFRVARRILEHIRLIGRELKDKNRDEEDGF